MTTFKRQLVAAVSAGSLLFSSASSVFAATTLEVSGNGASSDSTVKTENTGSTTVVQSNTAVVTNSISSNSSTGGNSASMNTGGEVAVKTGNAKTEVKVENNLNSNQAQVDCCANGDVDAKISGNGAYSDSEIKVKDSRDTTVFQDNAAKVVNKVSTDAKTGYNDADKNTGGDVTVLTGDASTKVDVATSANANYAKVGGQSSDHGSVSLKILGNGASSDNDIRVYLDDDKTIVQDNLADVYNSIKAEAKTGKNDANKNTGGDVAILTGDAKTQVAVDNTVNFNWADVDCGCITDLMAKVDGNGYDSDNYIKVKNDNDQDVFQGGKEGNGNAAMLNNSVWSDSATGKNDADKNTGGYDSDPWVMTGDSASYVDVSNSGNVNSYGADMPTEWPAFDFHFDLSLDWADLLAWMAAR